MTTRPPRDRRADLPAAGDEPDDEAPTRTGLVARAVFFLVLFVAAVVWVGANDGEHANAARHFLRQLLRHLF